MKLVCKQHETHQHDHRAGCGHTAVMHDGHTDYLHEGHLHYVHGTHVDEHTIAVNQANPLACTPHHQCDSHEGSHVHGPNCGHERAPHADHVDYLVAGHLHHAHNGHCDDHGPLKTVA